MTRCPANVPMDARMIRGSVVPGYACDGFRGHDGPHVAHEIGLSWRESDEAGLTLIWDEEHDPRPINHWGDWENPVPESAWKVQPSVSEAEPDPPMPAGVKPRKQPDLEALNRLSPGEREKAMAEWERGE